MSSRKIIISVLICFVLAGNVASRAAGQPATLQIANVSGVNRVIEIGGRSEKFNVGERKEMTVEAGSPILKVGNREHRLERLAVDRSYEVYLLEGGEISQHEQVDFRPGYEFVSGTQAAEKTKVYIDGKIAGTIGRPGEQLVVSTDPPPKGKKTTIEVRSTDGSRLLDETTFISVGTTTRYAVDIQSTADGISIQTDIVGAGVGANVAVVIDTGLAAQAVASAAIMTLKVPAIQLEAPVVPWDNLATVGKPKIGLPHNVAAWWPVSAAPGDVGISLFLGHVAARGNKPSIFFELDKLKVGDIVMVDQPNAQSKKFRVYENITAPKKSLPADVFGLTRFAEIRLISCDNKSKPDNRIPGEFHWSNNRIVFARLVG
jgi:hypothetical protein